MSRKKSREYWKKRYELIEEENYEAAAVTYEEIEEQFYATEKEIDNNIRIWYSRFAENNQISLTEARRLLNSEELEEFKWDVNQYIEYGQQNAVNQQWIKELENASARFHISRLESLKVQNQQSIEKLYGNQVDAVDQLIRNTYTDNYYKPFYETQKAFNVGWDITALNDKVLDSIIKKPWTTDGKTFSDRIWDNQEALNRELQQQLKRNIMLGKGPDDAIKDISKKFSVKKAAAGALVMTESAYFAQNAQKEAFEDLDVDKVEIIETLDSVTCSMCGDMDGKVIDAKDMEPGVTTPPFHPRCRGCTAPYFDDDVGERAARDGDGNTYYVPSDTKYNEWKEGHIVKDTNVSESDMGSNEDKETTPIATNSKIKSSSDDYDFNYEKKISHVEWDKYLNVSPETSQVLNNIHTDLNSHMIDNHAEKIVLLDKNTNKVLGMQVGEINLVDFNRETLHILKTAPKDSLILSHNHPSKTTFSNTDFSQLVEYKSINGLTVECVDGSKYILQRNGLKSSTLTKWSFYDNVDKIFDEVSLKYPGFENKETQVKVWDTFYNEYIKVLANRYKVTYRKVGY